MTYDPPDVKAAKEISTHTLTWSVTHMITTFRRGFWISTHTLTWSVTDRNDTMYEVYDNFNSHAHVERDYEEITGQKYESISTHTLTWSVTSRYS